MSEPSALRGGGGLCQYVDVSRLFYCVVYTAQLQRRVTVFFVRCVQITYLLRGFSG